MSILEAVIVIAGVIKQIADDSSANASMVKSLATRVEIIPRILKKIPENNELDDELLNRMHTHLKEAHRLLLKYQSRNSVTRMIKASSARLKFANVETELGRCIDDLSFNVGITSAAMIDSIRSDLRKEQGVTATDNDTTLQCEETENMKEEEEEMDLSGFDEMVTNIENLSTAIKLFSPQEELNNTSTINGTSRSTTSKGQVTDSPLPVPSIVLFGEKLIVQNIMKPVVESSKSNHASYIEYIEETQQENILLPPSGTHSTYNTNTINNIASSSNTNTGIIIFHIDNTSSMLREKRMELTKAVLRRIIPKLLRWGFRIVVNSWASTDANKGRISTREVKPPIEIMQGLIGVSSSGTTGGTSTSAGDSVESSAGTDEVEVLLGQYLDREVFDILLPKGRTDLYGSCFQLLQQCKQLISSGTSASTSATTTCTGTNTTTVGAPVYAFVLTDGEHNKLDCPTHRPIQEGEDYFGVYSAVRNAKSGKLKFERTGGQPSVSLCETQLRQELDKLNTSAGDNLHNSGSSSTVAVANKVTVTLIGIGDAETAPLSALSCALGEQQCSFYGITQVDQSEAVFQNIGAVSNSITVTCANSAESNVSLQLPLSFTYEEDMAGTVVTQGSAAAVTDHSALLLWHHTHTLALTQPSSASGSITTAVEPFTSVDISKQFDKYAADGSKNTIEYEAQRITRNELLTKIEEFVSEIRKIRSTAYTVDANSFGTVYQQLLLDKKKLQLIKTCYYSKYNRKYRIYSVFTALSIWVKELEVLIEHQLASYRMNVEAEILNRIVCSGSSNSIGDKTTGGVVASSGGYLQPTEIVLLRLQNNLHNAGRSTHKVLRHVAAVSSIRERTMHIAGTLFTTALSMQYLYSTSADAMQKGQVSTATPAGGAVVGLRLTVSRACLGTEVGKGKTYTVDWLGASLTAGQQLIEACVGVREIASEKSVSTSSLSRSIKQHSTIENVMFPCILLRAKFDQFTIIRATYLFFTCDIVTEQDTINLPETSGPVAEDLKSSGEVTSVDVPRVAVYCAQEVWELCHASNHIVGEVLPLSYYGSGADLCAPAGANMILPLAYTPMLFTLYVERSRAYHSAVNVTADCMALTVVSFQWAKLFHDALLFTAGVPCPALQTSSMHATNPSDKLRMFLDQALKAVVALSYCIDSAVMLPSKAGLNTMFGQSTEASGTDKSDPSYDDIIQPCVVMSRDDCPGLTASLAVAAVVAGGHLSYAERAYTWNLLLRTLYSRLAEAISGQKNVRHAISTATTTTTTPVTATASVPQDPGALEYDYRLKLGELQGLLRKRLYVEWVKCTAAEKRVQVQACAEPVLQCLRDIAQQFLLRLDSYGLQSWAQVSNMVNLALALSQQGILQLRQQLVDCIDLGGMVDQLLTAGKEYTTAPLLLPICVQATTTVSITTGGRDGSSSTGQLQMREAQPTDIDHIVMYIDALVATKAAPKIEYKPILNPTFPTYSAADNRALHFQHTAIEWDETLPSVNIAFIGNVNSGKSSISGMLLSSLGIILEAVVARLGTEAQKLGYSDSLKHAWVMDKTTHERAGGFTIKPTWAGFQTQSRRYTIIDNPGHKDYCRNTAIGVFQADAVVLVMPADIISNGTELHTGVNDNNNITTTATTGNTNTVLLSQQAEEHLLTAFCFGVREVVVAVNKMDLVQYSETVFEEVKAYTQKLLKKAGFKTDSAVFVPVSVVQNEGLMQTSEQMAWYTGPCLLQACDELPLPKRVVEKSFRMVVDDVYQHRITANGIGSTVLCGKIERGTVSLQDTVSLYPHGPLKAVVKSLQLHGTKVSQAQAGDNIGICIEVNPTTGSTASTAIVSKRGTEKNNRKTTPTTTMKRTLLKGSILTLSNQTPVSAIKRFEAQILVIQGSAFKVGYHPTLTTHAATVNVQITRLIELIGRNNTILESNPTAVKAGQTVVCEMTALHCFAGETIHDMPKLSRFLIKADRSTIAIGFIRKILS